MAQALDRDAQIQAQSALADCPIYDVRNLQVEHQDDCLIISGLVSRFYYKQLAQEIVFSACGEVNLRNMTQVG